MRAPKVEVSSDATAASHVPATIAPLRLDGESRSNAGMKWFEEVCTTHGGPGQYLEKKYSTEMEKNAFAAKLRAQMPGKPGIAYFDPERDAQTSDGEPILLHAVDLCFDYTSSTRLWPYPNVCKEIMDDILHNGFKSAEQPMMVMLSQV